MTLSPHHEFSAPDRVVMHVGGRLDAMTFGELDEAMPALLPQLDDGGTVVVDLAGLEYVSSAGCAVSPGSARACAPATATPCC